MNWVTAALLAGYIGVCEYRAPSPWVACESRWNWALGVLVPSPIQGAIPAAGRMLGLGRRRRPEAGDVEPKP
jgi:hypothetical protein